MKAGVVCVLVSCLFYFVHGECEQPESPCNATCIQPECPPPECPVVDCPPPICPPPECPAPICPPPECPQPICPPPECPPPECPPPICPPPECPVPECPLPECSCNEEWACKNPYSVNTCQHPGGIQQNCDENNCIPGCYCKEGYWRDEERGVCVEMSECPCEKKGRVFGYSNPCINSCQSRICPMYAVAGCFCPDGQCENEKGVCVPDCRYGNSRR